MNKTRAITLSFLVTAIMGSASLLTDNPLLLNTVVATENIPSVTKEAKEAVVRYFKAQKNNDVDGMMENSKYVIPINNLKEFYTGICKNWSLISTTITDVKVVNDTLALVSYESKYKDRVFISTAPVYKENGTWKLITGIPPVSHIQTSLPQQSREPVDDAEQALTSYFKAQKEGNVEEMMKYRKDVYFTDVNELKKYLTGQNGYPLLEGKIRGMTVIDNTLVLASIESNFQHTTHIETVPVYKDKEGWKIVFGCSLLKNAIPVGDNPTEVK